MFDTFKKIKLDAFLVLFVFLISLTFYPGFTLMMKNNDVKSFSKNNYMLVLISIFQLFDFIGRTLPKWVIIPNNPNLLWIPSLLRVVCIPLFIIAIYTDWFPSNYISFLIVAVFAWSNGYFGTLLMMSGPQRVVPRESKNAGILMGCLLQVGVFIGVHLAMILMISIEGVNTFIE